MRCDIFNQEISETFCKNCEISENSQNCENFQHHATPRHTIPHHINVQ